MDTRSNGFISLNRGVFRPSDITERSRPNPPIQPTPLCVHKIGAILSLRICYNDIATYLGGAADGQLVGPRGALSPLVACLGAKQHAACSISAAAPARMPTLARRRRILPVSLAARICFCPSRRCASAACPYRSFHASSLPRLRNSDLGMLSRGCCAVAYALPVATPACHALSAGAALSIMLTQSGR